MSTTQARHALFGHPVAHSLSPHIHAMFGREAGIALSYEPIDCQPEDFAAALDRFAAAGGTGANVTLPLKEVAFAVCTEVSDRAQASGVINTLIRDGDGWRGDNTDGVGLLRDLRNRQALDLRQRRTLLLGAGGGARGVAPSLIDAGIGDLYVVNRDSVRADALVDRLGLPARIHSRYYDDLGGMGDFSLIINATSAARNVGLPKLPMSLIGSRTACVDLSYGEASIPFLSWARAARAHDVIDGLGMLVEQAAESFKLWHGVRPDADEVYAELRLRHDTLVTAD